jgi:hypothetical protein
MAKAIYSLKIFLFGNEFKLNTEDVNGVPDFCIFLAKMYIKSWFTAPSVIKAPNQNFQFLKKTRNYAAIDPNISRAVLNKLKNHLWYLSSEAIALAFFYNNVR